VTRGALRALVPSLLAGVAGVGAVLVPVEPASADVDCIVGQTRYVDTPSYTLLRLAAGRTWDLSVGQGTTVAVVDSGVEDANAHLSDVTLPGRSFVAGEPDAREDDWGHGTAVAGIIAAQFLDDSSVIGLAPGAKILPVRVYRAEPSEDSQPTPAELPSTDRMAAGIRWAAEQGPDVINVSMSATADDPALREAVRYAVRHDIVVVASAGNRTSRDEENGVRYPAAYPGVIGVAASDTNDTVTSASIHGPQVDVSAPGENVLTSFFGSGDCLIAQDRPYSSYAAGYVSALAALLRERYPDESAKMVAYRIMSSADRPQRDARDNVGGWGLIQPYDALTMTPDPSRPGPPMPGAPQPQQTVSRPVVRPVLASPDPRQPAQQSALWWALFLGGLVVLTFVLRPWVRSRAGAGEDSSP
jgi:type VII secretion-associated serine protease mycosin